MTYTGPTDDELKARITAWIRDYLEENPNQKRLADDLGVSEPTISNIVRGHLKPGFRVLVRLHLALGAELREVLRWRARSAKGDVRPQVRTRRA